VTTIALTDGSEQNTRTLLRRACLDRYIETVVATAHVGVYKPHPAVYRRGVEAIGLPPERVTLIAAHAWDVAGAEAAGLDAVWIERLERRWPLPIPEATKVADLREAAALVLR
jgi:2-haloacid dehalogenase